MNGVGIDELLSASLDDDQDGDLSLDDRAALERRLAADGDARVSLEAMARVRTALRSLPADMPPDTLDDMLSDFRRRLDARVTPVLEHPLQDSLRAMQATLGKLRQTLTSGDRRQRIQRLVEAADGMCPPLGESS